MTRPIVGYLAEFDRVAAPTDLTRAGSFPTVTAAASREAERAALVEAARREGEAEGRRQAEADVEARCHNLAEAYEAALAASRAQWVAEQATVLSEGLRTGFSALEATLAADMAAALGPLVEPAIRSRTVAGLRVALAELTAGGQGALIAVTAPADIVAALRADWGAHPAVTLAEGEGAEALVEAGATTIRSQMQAWSAQFKAACGTPE